MQRLYAPPGIEVIQRCQERREGVGLMPEGADQDSHGWPHSPQMGSLSQRPDIPCTFFALVGDKAQAAVHQGETPRRVERDAQRMAEEHAEQRAVRNDDQPLAGMPPGQIGQRGDAATLRRCQAFAAGRDIVRRFPLDLRGDLRILRLHLGILQPFQHAEALLAQPRIGDHGQAARRADMLGGDQRPREIAAVERIDRLVGQPLGDGLRLRDAERRQRAVGLALAAAFQVPKRFAVANQNQAVSGSCPEYLHLERFGVRRLQAQLPRDLPVRVEDALIEAVAARIQVALLL